MSSRILINAVDPGECRIAKLEDLKLEEFHMESASRESHQGNIYKGTIIRVETGLQSVFVDYGAKRHGFLQKQEIHTDYHVDASPKNHSIKQIVKRGQELLVQVTKAPFGNKGAVLTTYLSLPGRHLVLMPGSDSRGISRKIADEEERGRLKKILGQLKMPDGYGIIVRTAGEGCSKTILNKDLRYLMRLWKNIKGRVMKVKAPALLYRERNLVLRSLRDYFTSDVTEILIDDANVHREVKNFMQVISNKHIQNVKLYTGEKPIFTKYELESQIASIFEKRVKLKSGGSIVIDQTEALVAVDVNSGSATRGTSVEDTAFKTNLEAAEEIARQLRLRDLGGLVVLDFIDMRDAKHNHAVERALRDNLKRDKAKTKTGKISKFGLLEMSRQRLRPSLESGSYEPCAYCHGKGLTPSTEKLGLSFLRELSLGSLKGNISTVKGVVPPDVADYLLNQRRKDLFDLEVRRNVHITLQADAAMKPGDSEIIYEKQ